MAEAVILPVIADDSSWLDLRIGDQAIVRGKLDYVGDRHLIIVFSDWSKLLIDCESPGALIHYGRPDIEITVTRDEDGLFAEQAAIADAANKLKERM